MVNFFEKNMATDQARLEVEEGVAGGSCCSYKNVWGRAQDGNGGDNSEGRKDDEAKAVDDHGGKLPVADHLIFFLLHLHPVRDKLELL